MIHAGKLHKLMYYAQKYSIEMTLLPLFSEPIEAWIYGATVRAVYKLHRGQEYISWSDIPESRINKLSEQHKRIILNTLEKYTELSTAALSVLNQEEYAFVKARGDLAFYTKGTKGNEITIELIKEGIDLNK